MLAHADKRTAATSIRTSNQQPSTTNYPFAEEEKEMSFMTTLPEAMTATAGGLQDVGSTVAAGNAAAAAPTTGVVPAAADAVSALTAAQFATHAQMYQAVSAQAAAIHEHVCGHPGGQRRLVRGHRGRHRGRAPLTRFGHGFRGVTPGDQLRAACMPVLDRDRCWPPRRPGMGWPLELGIGGEPPTAR